MAETLDLDAIRARCEAATEGPWFTQELGRLWVGNRADGRESGLWEIVYGTSEPLVDLIRTAQDRERRNADFIAHARTDIPALVAEIERLRSGVTADV